MKIFLSHASRDKQTVDCFKERLPEFLRSSAWLDVNSISWSDSLPEKLREAITGDVDFLIPFIAHDTLTSKWVEQELQWAFHREEELGRKFVLPIILDPDARETLPPELANRLHLTLHSFANSDIEHLAKQATLKLFEIVAGNYARADSGTRLRRAMDQALREGYGVNHPRNMWTRPMLRLPLRPSITRQLLNVMKDARRVAIESIRQDRGTADPAHVRSAIFFPEGDRVQEGIVCTLRIPDAGGTPPKKLQLNLNRDEVNVIFRPNEGATGQVFVRGRAAGVLTHHKWLEAGKLKRKKLRRWMYAQLSPTASVDDTLESLEADSGAVDFDMRGFQEELADSELTWIISMPIFKAIGGSTEVVGVFNVDGIKTKMKHTLLRNIFYSIVPFAGMISGIIKDQQVDRIAILKMAEGAGS